MLLNSAGTLNLIRSISYTILAFTMSIQFVKAQEEDATISTLAFYNCENLFDTIDAPFKDDYEWLPKSQKNWNSVRYNKKLHNLARVILAVGDWNGPEVIGLCEVENRMVLQDLVNQTNLRNFNYGIIHKESPDKRGIDVAMLYKKDKFEVLHYHYFKITFGSLSKRPTRDLLYVKGIMKETDTIHVFVNHWPSRYGGAAASAPKRVMVAEKVKGIVDSINARNPNSNIVITGDLNDGTEDESILQGLKAKNEGEVKGSELFNTSYYLQHEKKLGTHKFQDEWNLFDQMILSASLINGTGKIKYVHQSSEIYNPEWLQHEDIRFFGQKPFRTYSGANYLGGYSDHFPIRIRLQSLN